MYISKAKTTLIHLSDFKGFSENGHYFGNYDILEDKIIFTFEEESEYKHFNGLCKCNSISYEVIGLKGSREEINEDYLYLVEA